MELPQDNHSDGSVQAAYEVTCTDYLQDLDNRSEDKKIAHVPDRIAPNTNLNAIAAPFYNFNMWQRDSYTWKMVNKRARPGHAFNFVSGLWDENSTSSSYQTSVNSIAYMRNWSLMQNHFYWDYPLPVPKRARITELEMEPNDKPNVDTKENEELKEIKVIESTVSAVNQPHQCSEENHQAPKEMILQIIDDYDSIRIAPIWEFLCGQTSEPMSSLFWFFLLGLVQFILVQSAAILSVPFLFCYLVQLF